MQNMFIKISLVLSMVLTCHVTNAAEQSAGHIVAELLSNKCIDINGGSQNDGANAIQYTCSSADNQQFNFVAVGSAFQIKAAHSGKCLGVLNASTANGAKVVQLTCDTSKNHMLWRVSGTGARRQIIAQHSNMCLNVSNASTADYTQIVQWPCSSDLNEQWRVHASSVNGVLPTLKSQWKGPYALPLVAAAAASLPNGKVLTWSAYAKTDFSGGFNKTYTAIFDPATNKYSEALISNTGHDMFCPGTAMLADGRIMVTGGNNSQATSVYNPSTNTWASGDLMNITRGYHAMTLLANGNVFTIGGSWSGGRGGKNGELWSPENKWQRKSNLIVDSLMTDDAAGVYRADNHMWLFPAPNGKIFQAGPSKRMNWISVEGDGNMQGTQLRGDDADAMSGNAVMYDIGKILTLGGSRNYDAVTSSSNVVDIDINAGEGNEVVKQLDGMLYPRVFHNSVALPSGEVVVVGGQKISQGFSDVQSILAAEIWNPNTGKFSKLADMQVPRNYHSVALLLNDGRVFVSGSGLCGNCSANHADVEILTPPYLLNDDGTSAVRPIIQSAPASAKAGDTINVTMNTSGVHRFALMRLGAVTHTVNNDQRRVPLEVISQNSSQFSLRLPANQNVLIPGNYFLFALNQTGVPSIAKVINVPITTSSTNGGGQPVDVNNGSLSSVPMIASGATAVYQATTSAGFTYSWNFGDGSADTPYTTSSTASHTFSAPGVYVVTLSTKDSNGLITRKTYIQAVSTGKTSNSPTHSSPIAVETRSGNSARIWTVNPDNDSVSVIDADSKAAVATINVDTSPRTIAIAPDGRIWVVNKKSATISIISPTTLAVVQTINLARASQPHGLAFSPTGANAYVVLEAKGQLLKLNPSTGAQVSLANIGSHPRHLSINADGSRVFVSRFITPPLPGEATAAVNVTNASNVGGEVLVINTADMSLNTTIRLKHSDKTDNPVQGSGIPNYLGAAVISPDGSNAWVPSKQDNIKRGMARSGLNLDFQNTVRAISSRINLSTLSEEHDKRVDHDNSSVGSAAVYHPSGVYLFVALETSRQVAVVDAIAGNELFKIDIGRAPQGLALSADGNTLYAHEFMDRSISVIDLGPLLKQGLLRATVTNVVIAISAAQEKLSASVVLGKQLFYDAKDTRLAKDSYMSCASCHNDGGHDGRVWDLTGLSEGLRNTINLKGRAGMGHGFLHWSANFDEVQDFEKQIRDLAGGLGLMTDAQYNTGTRNQALGDKKAGISTSLDELASYLASLTSFDESPHRDANGALTAAATAGKTVFANSCASCHGGANFTTSSDGANLKNIGSINSLSGQRLGATLTGIDVPTLRDAWTTAPYMHNGSATTITEAIQAHNNLSLTAADIANVVAYVQQIGSEEAGVVATPTNNLPANAVYCAVEGEVCTLPAGMSATVWYGVNDSWYTKAGVTGAISCSNDVFGDALPDVGKYCFYVSSSTTPVNIAPTVSITAPATGVAVSQGTTVAITATAADSDGTVARVEFYDGTTLLGTDTTSPYAFSWVTSTATATGSHSLTTRAYDNAEAVTSSAAVSVTVNTSSSPPTGSIYCAKENSTCKIPAGSTATVWYGANTRWAVKTGVSGSIACNNSTFGDPIRGTVKTCRYVAN